ncbi:hypothetical protein TcCL_Unassigned02429 [Trypanosoma cruzi]|nr:hypothetical protein TcCL_Unassigned02429 [Trypanosoma cruzi]
MMLFPSRCHPLVHVGVLPPAQRHEMRNHRSKSPHCPRQRHWRQQQHPQKKMVKLSQPDPQLLHSALHPLLVQCLFCRSSVGFMVAGTSVEDGSALCGGDFGGGSDGPAGASYSAAVGGNSSHASFFFLCRLLLCTSLCRWFWLS